MLESRQQAGVVTAQEAEYYTSYGLHNKADHGRVTIQGINLRIEMEGVTLSDWPTGTEVTLEIRPKYNDDRS